MGKSSGSSVPNPAATAAAQSTANVNTAAANAALNYTNQYTPYGSTIYQPTGQYTSPEGQTVPTYSQFTELSPMGQQILTGQQSVVNNLLPYAGTLAGQAGAAATTPLNLNSTYSQTLQNPSKAGQQFNTSLSNSIQSIPGQIQNYKAPYENILRDTPGQLANLNTPLYQQVANAPGAIANLQTPFDSTYNKGPELLNQDVTNAIYRQQSGFLNPQWDDRKQQLENQLSRQGIPVGSEAYNSAVKQYDNSRTQAYQSAQDSAIAGGTGAASNLFNMALAGRGQNLGQAEAAAQAAMQAQGLTTAQQQAAFNAGLAGKQSNLGQMESAFQAAMGGQGLANQQQNQGFNQALSGQQQYLSQQQMAQQQPIALLAQLLGAAPATPSQPIATPVANAIAPTDVVGATGISQNAANNAAAQQTASSNATMGGVASLGGAAILAIAL